MLTSPITLNDGVVARTYTKVSQEGMNATYAETTAGVVSSSRSTLSIKNTKDDRATSKPNRHLVSITFTEYDAAGLPCATTVHCVITRHKNATDATVLKVAEMLSNFIGTPDNVSSLLIGGN